MDYLFEFSAKNRINGAYYEFGVFEGASFIRAYRAFRKWSDLAQKNDWPLRMNKLYAFDSFEGLPELRNGDIKQKEAHFTKGQYACSKSNFISNIKKANVNLDKVSIYKGFFDELLTQQLSDELKDNIAVLHIDVDLYSSAERVLSFCGKHLQDGSLIAFDDYYCYKGNPDYGVQRAFLEWQKNNNIQAISYLNYSWAGKVFIINR